MVDLLSVTLFSFHTMRGPVVTSRDAAPTHLPIATKLLGLFVRGFWRRLAEWLPWGRPRKEIENQVEDFLRSIFEVIAKVEEQVRNGTYQPPEEKPRPPRQRVEREKKPPDKPPETSGRAVAPKPPPTPGEAQAAQAPARPGAVGGTPSRPRHRRRRRRRHPISPQYRGRGDGPARDLEKIWPDWSRRPRAIVLFRYRNNIGTPARVDRDQGAAGEEDRSREIRYN